MMFLRAMEENPSKLYLELDEVRKKQEEEGKELLAQMTQKALNDRAYAKKKEKEVLHMEH